MTAKPLCTAVKPVCISKDDRLTRGTAKQLLANELGREDICGKPPECPREGEQPKTS